MYKNINKFLSPHQIGIPLTGLVLILGVLAVGRATPVLSNQADYLSIATNNAIGKIKTYTWLQRNSQEQKEVRLGSVLNSPLSQNNLKAARLHKAIAKTVPVEDNLQAVHHQEQTYTWLQRHPSVVAEQSVTPTTLVAETEAPTKSKLPKKDGVYLYGQSPKPGESGQGYIIFENRQSNVVGALYVQDSEYSCFNGKLQSSGQLAMTVTGYPGEIGPIRVATKNTSPRGVVDNTEPAIYSHSEALQDYYQLHSVSANDLDILQKCKANNS